MLSDIIGAAAGVPRSLPEAVGGFPGNDGRRTGPRIYVAGVRPVAMSDGPASDDTDDDRLPSELRSLATPETEDVVALYNGLQGMEEEAFRAAFAGSLDELKDAADDVPSELESVLGLELEDGAVTDATLLSVREREGERVLFSNDPDEVGVPDAAVYLPVRPDDFPPGSDAELADMDVDAYREVVSAMVFLRYQLARESPDQLDSRYREPLRRGLASFADG